jgi:tetratricopeptide (TPR) repeat protein
MRTHPHDASLWKAARGAERGLERILEHVASCVQCRARLARKRHQQEGDEFPLLGRSLGVLAHWQATLERERSEAPSLFDSLVALTPGQQLLLLRNSHRFRTWGLFELLIERGKEETFSNPKHAEQLLHLALRIADDLSPASYGRELIEDLRARAWGFIANARRCRRELAASEEAFGEAFSRLRRGTTDPLEQALLFDLQASLRRYQGRLEESLRLSRRAISTFHKLGQTQAVGKALVTSSIAHVRRGDLARSSQGLHRALGLIDPTREPRLALCALNNLARDLEDTGHFLEARRVLLKARTLFTQFPDTKNYRLWLEGNIAGSLGRQGEAESALQQAIDGFLSADTPELADQVARDLAALRPHR